MVNLIEQGSQRFAEQETIRESLREIFTTAINILGTKGSLKKGFTFPFLKHQSFRDDMGFYDPKVPVRIIAAGKDLKKARELFMLINGVGYLEVRKTSVKGQEKFEGRESRVGAYSGSKLDGSRDDHIETVRGYLCTIRQIHQETLLY